MSQPCCHRLIDDGSTVKIVVDLALDTGFGSQANFIRVFRKVTGLTPGQYREMHRR